MKREITLERDGLLLAGVLFTPTDFVETGHYRAIVVQGSLSSVKEMMASTYARKFADQGFVALAFDYSHYGASAGEPRQLESPGEKLRDLQAAVSYLGAQSFVQAVGVVGICTSAANAVCLVAVDERVKALATIAAFLPNPDLYSSMFGADGVADRKSRAVAARHAYEETGATELIPVYSETDPGALNYRPTTGAYDYYLNPQRGNVPEYRNEFAVAGLDGLLEFDPLTQAGSITTPTIVVHSDGSAFPEEAKRLYESLDGVKELVWADGNHFDYYDSPAQIDNAVTNVARFLRTHLEGGASASAR